MLPGTMESVSNWQFKRERILLGLSGEQRPVPRTYAMRGSFLSHVVSRWLLTQGQTDRAVSILRTFARVNKKQVDESVYKKLKVSLLPCAFLSRTFYCPQHCLDLLKQNIRTDTTDVSESITVLQSLNGFLLC